MTSFTDTVDPFTVAKLQGRDLLTKSEQIYMPSYVVDVNKNKTQTYQYPSIYFVKFNLRMKNKIILNRELAVANCLPT